MSPIQRRQMLHAFGASFLITMLAPTAIAGKGAQTSARQSNRTGGRSQTRNGAGYQSRAVQRSRQNGGHLNQHVAQSRSALAQRAAQKGMRLNFEAARLGVSGRKLTKTDMQKVPKGFRRDARKANRQLRNYNMSPKQTSTFRTGRQADTMYARALRANRAEIRAWLKTPPAKRGPLSVKFDAKSPVGTVYSRRHNTYSIATKGAFFLKTIPGTNRVYPVSAKLY